MDDTGSGNRVAATPTPNANEFLETVCSMLPEVECHGRTAWEIPMKGGVYTYGVQSWKVRVKRFWIFPANCPSKKPIASRSSYGTLTATPMDP